MSTNEQIRTELGAMQQIVDALDSLGDDQEAVDRVLRYVNDRYGSKP